MLGLAWRLGQGWGLLAWAGVGDVSVRRAPSFPAVGREEPERHWVMKPL